MTSEGWWKNSILEYVPKSKILPLKSAAPQEELDSSPHIVLFANSSLFHNCCLPPEAAEPTRPLYNHISLVVPPPTTHLAWEYPSVKYSWQGSPLFCKVPSDIQIKQQHKSRKKKSDCSPQAKVMRKNIHRKNQGSDYNYRRNQQRNCILPNLREKKTLHLPSKASRKCCATMIKKHFSSTLDNGLCIVLLSSFETTHEHGKGKKENTRERCPVSQFYTFSKRMVHSYLHHTISLPLSL